MSKLKRPTLTDLALEFASPPTPAPGRDPASPNSVQPALRPRARPQVTLYISKRAQKEIKQIALTYDKRPHDIMVEAIELVLAKYGRPNLADLAD